MCHFSYPSSASLLPGLYFFSSLPAWQWGAVPPLSALNHRDRLELGCPKMVAFTSQKQDWRSHLHCRVRHFLLPPFSPTVIFFLLQQKMIAWIVLLISAVEVFCKAGRFKWLWKFCCHHWTGNKEGNSTSVHSNKPKYPQAKARI